MKEEALRRIISMAARLAAQINECISDEECQNYIDLEEEDATEFMHALMNLAPATIYDKLTNNESDILEINHIANQLCFQFTERPKEQ